MSYLVSIMEVFSLARTQEARLAAMSVHTPSPWPRHPPRAPFNTPPTIPLVLPAPPLSNT